MVLFKQARGVTWMVLFLASACVGRNGATPTAAGTCVVDLSYAYDEQTVYWPTAPSKFEKEELHYGPTDAGYFYSAFMIATPEHGGTHLDAPINFAEGQTSAEAIPLERLIAPAVVIDITEDANRDRDALLTREHIEDFEQQHGSIARGTIVLVRTGWSRHWPDVAQYLGDDTVGDVSNLHFPGISEDAAQALVEREVAAVGIDTASIDHGPSKDFMAHRVLMEAGVPAFENVAALDRLPARGSRIIALPMKIRGGSGAPLRIVAELPAQSCAGE